MPKPISIQFNVIWANLDPNNHMRHTAYNDYAAQVRVRMFDEFGFPLHKIMKMGYGPLLFQENTTFIKEVRMNETITVDCAAFALRTDKKIWKFRHQVFNSEDELACKIEVTGAFLDLKARKIVTPPEEISNMLDQIPTTDDFEWFDK